LSSVLPASRIIFCISGDARAFAISALSLSTIGFGVRAGANTPDQPKYSNPVRPCS